MFHLDHQILRASFFYVHVIEFLDAATIVIQAQCKLPAVFTERLHSTRSGSGYISAFSGKKHLGRGVCPLYQCWPGKRAPDAYFAAI